MSKPTITLRRYFDTGFALAIGAALLIGCDTAASQQPALPEEEPAVQEPVAEETEEPEPPAESEADVPDSAQTNEMGYTPVFEPGNCPFHPPVGYVVECGHLIVPEDRSQPDGPQVRLPVAIFENTSLNPAPDPVIHLVGGPGGNLLDASSFYLDRGGNQILLTRDYILFNQRGTHYTEPSLECPGQDVFTWDLVGQPLSLEERDAQEIDFLIDCQEHLLGQGANLAAYNTAENAADVNDLRIALGYEQVNLYGISYGTRLALAMMRDYPEGIRSVIIDSVFPPQVNLDSDIALNANRAFGVLFDACAADPDCRQSYPNLEETFYQTVDDLNANPVAHVVDGHTVMVDGALFAECIFGTLYRTDVLVWIPLMIHEVSRGNLSPIEEPLRGILDTSGVSSGMYYSVFCHEETPFDSYETARALAADLPPQIADSFAVPFLFTLCESWESGQAGQIENEPVVSDIPTLVLSGQYDPVTPPAYGQLAAETLSNSFYYEFTGVGHGVMRSNQCGLSIGLQFLDNPTVEPDTYCMESLTAPHFE